MLNIKSFTFNPFQENTYLIINEKQECWIIDPGMSSPAENDSFHQFIKAEKLTPKAIFNTHAHIDHLLGVDEVKSRYAVSFFVHEEEYPLLNNAMAIARMYGMPLRSVPQTEGKIVPGKIWFGDDMLEVLFVPGHSPGSVAFYYPIGKWLIGGDTLFLGSIGRTDLPGGNHEQLIQSIKRELLSLPEDTIVYSGHGPATLIGREKSGNPFII